MKVTLDSKSDKSTPVFTLEQVEYLRKMFPAELRWDGDYTMETIHRTQGQAQVIYHVASLVSRQSK